MFGFLPASPPLGRGVGAYLAAKPWSKPAFPGTARAWGARVEEPGGRQSPVGHKVTGLGAEASDLVPNFRGQGLFYFLW